MKSTSETHSRRARRRATVTLSLSVVLVVAALAAVTGCKNNPSTASSHAASVAAPPAVDAYPASPGGAVDVTLAGLAKAEPTDSWLSLVPPIGETRTTPATRVALRYDAEHLYVACVGQRGGERAASSVSIWLDNTAHGNGTEYFELVLDPDKGVAKQAVWHRSTQPPTPRADGTPNFAHPLSHVPDTAVAGLRVQSGEATLEGQRAWVVVAAIPLKALPTPLRATPVAGKTWRVNVVRQDLEPGQPARHTLQSNLSPVYLNAQAVMPYRMAKLTLADRQRGARAAN